MKHEQQKKMTFIIVSCGKYCVLDKVCSSSTVWVHKTKIVTKKRKKQASKHSKCIKNVFLCLLSCMFVFKGKVYKIKKNQEKKTLESSYCWC